MLDINVLQHPHHGQQGTAGKAPRAMRGFQAELRGCIQVYQCGQCSHGHGLARARVAVGLSIHRAVAAGPVVTAVADGVIAAGAMARAVV